MPARLMAAKGNTAAWLGKDAEIYVTFPQDIVGLRLSDAMRIEWRMWLFHSASWR